MPDKKRMDHVMASAMRFSFRVAPVFWLALMWPAVQNVALANDGVAILEKAGLDTALLEQTRNGTVRAFIEDESYLFAGLAAAMVRLEQSPPGETARPFDLLAALQDPVGYRAAFVQLEGHVRRVSRIQIESQRLHEACGQDHYFHVDLFVSTRQRRFHLKDTQGEVILGGSYGLTLILFQRPDFLMSDKPVSISVPGFFLKNWSHKTVDTREVSDELRRPNPIVFGIASLTTEIDDESSKGVIDSFISWFWGGMIALLLLWTARQFWQTHKRSQTVADHSGPVDLSHLEDAEL